MSRMPAVFFGHGNPLNALADNDWTRGWAALGRDLPRPRGIVCVSAHWYKPGAGVTANEQPRTIHDFGGFPKELFEVQYPAPGSPELAQRVESMLAPTPAPLDERWGLDHGTWSVLMHAYPDADIPIVQLAIDETKDARWHFELAKHLRPLRDDGVLVCGSGNLVHNLHTYSWGRTVQEPYDWALRFEAFARERMAAHDFDPLIAYEKHGKDAMLSAPTPDHYLPLLYVLAQHEGDESVSFPVEGFDGGSVSMLSVRVG